MGGGGIDDGQPARGDGATSILYAIHNQRECDPKTTTCTSVLVKLLAVRVGTRDVFTMYAHPSSAQTLFTGTEPAQKRKFGVQ